MVDIPVLTCSIKICVHSPLDCFGVEDVEMTKTYSVLALVTCILSGGGRWGGVEGGVSRDGDRKRNR